MTEFQEKFAENKNKRGPESFLYPDEEKKITEWIIHMCKCGFPLKWDDLLNAVQKIIRDIGRVTPFKDHRPRKTWLKIFFKRNPVLVSRKVESISKARAIVKEASMRK